jgi:ketosteroid isomerase-like protein
VDAWREELVRRFFAVMNEHDAARLDEVFADGAEIVMGPHTARGLGEIREIVLQETPGAQVVSDVKELEQRDADVVASFVRRQSWTASDDPAVEEDLWATFAFADGRISRAELLRSPPG